MDHKDVAAFMNSPKFVPILIGIASLIVAVVVFEAGVAVGFHKAEYAEHWEENYNRNFGSTGFYGMPDGGVPNPHGANGRIVSVTLPNFVIAGGNGPERVIVTTSDTIVRDGDKTVSTQALTVGEDVVVLGAPSDDGDVDATLVRILPPPEAREATSSPTSSTTTQ